MLLTVPFRNKTIRVSDEGKGNAVVFLHGYLESLDIWDGFYERFALHYRVVRIDIPGHGESGVVAKVHSMDLMAEAVETVLQHLGIEKCVLAGHSMGGYVSLAFLAHFSKYLAGVCLFHSSPFADTEEKKASRAKEIKLVEGGKLILICNTSIPNGFATDHLEKMADKLEFAKEVARRSSPEGVIAILEGMRSRPDRQELLKKNHLPVLFILGKKDHYIAFDKLAPIAASFPHSKVSALEESGHSGYFEEPEKSAGFLLSFLDECYHQLS